MVVDVEVVVLKNMFSMLDEQKYVNTFNLLDAHLVLVVVVLVVVVLVVVVVDVEVVVLREKKSAFKYLF